MQNLSPRDPDFAARCRDSFLRQKAMALLGAEMSAIEPGFCRLELPYRDDLTQQHGFFHGGFVAALADSAAGYAAFTLFPADASILTVEFKINLMAPAQGERLAAEGRVVRSGRTLTVVDVDVFGIQGDRRNLIARGLETLICLEGRPDTPAGFKNATDRPSLNRKTPQEETR